MHDLDRISKEFAYEDEDEHDSDGEWEYHNREFSYENEVGQEETYSTEYESADQEVPLTEEEEMELATEFLSIANDRELDQFLGNLFKKVSQGAKRFFRSPVLQKVGGFLKGIAKKALPIAGSVVGGMFGGPLGSKLGGKLGSFASRIFELELEGLSPEDQEFEVARQYVRFAAAAANKVAQTPTNIPVDVAAKKVIHAAAKQHAPGLLKPSRSNARSGTWARKGNRIIVKLF
jgi:hypothetical protein